MMPPLMVTVPRPGAETMKNSEIALVGPSKSLAKTSNCAAWPLVIRAPVESSPSGYASSMADVKISLAGEMTNSLIPKRSSLTANSDIRL